jgi:SAM-dependent methyltransferase
MSISWDEQYGRDGHLWGKGPSELALFLVEDSDRLGLPPEPVDIVDIGCGYGRDVAYIAEHIPCRILGIDSSANAIAMAEELARQMSVQGVQFRCCDFGDLAGAEYDVVFMSNVYHVLRADDRRRLREAVGVALRPDGLLLLTAHSVNDPQHYGEGEPVEGETNSFEGEKFVHLSTRKELEADFGFIDIIELFEHAYEEPRTYGVHHHVTWVLVGRGRG